MVIIQQRNRYNYNKILISHQLYIIRDFHCRSEVKDFVGRLGKGFKTVTIYSSEPRISIKGIYSKWIYADTPKQIQV